MVRLSVRRLLPLVLAAALLAGCGGDGDTEEAPVTEGAVSDAGPQHVHGLGVDPKDDALYIATHSGLWRAPAGEAKASRVGDAQHDLMGFTVAGPGRFLASGHPDARSDLPPLLGLQTSSDGGESWESISLLGEADLHVLRAAGRRIYGVDASTGRFLTSDDGGRSWDERSPPGPVFDLALDPNDPNRLVAATEQGLFGSTDTGRRWRPINSATTGLLAWPQADALYLVDGQGAVSRSKDGGRAFDAAGTLPAAPEAFTAAGDQLLAAVHGGEVLVSGDGGGNWQVRSRP